MARAMHFKRPSCFINLPDDRARLLKGRGCCGEITGIYPNLAGP
jgi:hypothetical protein